MNSSYGKTAVSVYRTDSQSALFAAEIRLDVVDDGLRPAYTAGDNSLVVPTDTMKNFIYAIALDYDGASLEDFLDLLGRKFLATYRHFHTIRLRGRELPFARHGQVIFRRLYDDYATAELAMDRSGMLDHRSGREGLHLIKLTGSSFVQFHRDAYTTLPEMPDRPLLIYLNIYWRHADFRQRVASEAVRDAVCETFDTFVSKSIQHLIHEMGRRLLTRFPVIQEVAFEAENHLWDTARLSEVDPRIKVYTDPRPPFGVISLTLKR